MRHQADQKFERKRYLKEKKIGEGSKRRLEMLDIKNNMGNGRKCKCGEKDTSEHLITCEKYL